MTDSGRKDMSDKLQDKVTPNESKSTTDKVSDTLSGGADKAQRDIVPDSQKSTTQSAQDKMSREKDSHSNESMLDKAKHAVGMDKK